MILHTIKDSPFSHKALEQLLARLGDADYLLLVENGVIAAATDHALFDPLEKLFLQQRLFVLDADLSARGLTAKVGKVVDYKGFVSLVVQADSSIAW